ncbi:DNA-directed DNA polymerases, partial [Zea mays]
MPNNGRSLANMWGRASAKPKPPSTTNSTAVESVATTLDAQICAKEEADGDNSDDEQGIKYKREFTNANNRKRRAVFDFSDDDEVDNIISITSPEVPKQRIPDLVIETTEDAEVNQKNLENKDDVPNTEKGSSMGVDSNFTSECKTKTVNTMNHSGITLKENSSDPPVSNKKQDSAVEPTSTAPKRRKVLKTHIDERGRE